MLAQVCFKRKLKDEISLIMHTISNNLLFGF